MRRHRILLVFAGLLLGCSNLGYAIDNEDYATYAKEQAEKAKVITEPYKKKIEELIKNVEAKQGSQDIKRIQNELRTISKAQCQSTYEDVLITPKDESVPKLPPCPMAIFISFSMPKESMRLWVSQAEKIGASVYLRGLVNNSFKDTVLAVKALLHDQKGGVLIDPTIFKKHGITQVPAVVFVSKGNASIVYGDVTLDYALERINKEINDPYNKNLLVGAIKKLRQAKDVFPLTTGKTKNE